MGLQSLVIQEIWLKTTYNWKVSKDVITPLSMEKERANLAEIRGVSSKTITRWSPSARSPGFYLNPPPLVGECFLAGVLAERDSDITLLLTSDHGNIEDVRVGHTLNPALGAAFGPRSAAAASLGDLREVTPFILGLLDADG